MLNELRDSEDQVLGVGVLEDLPVNRKPDIESMGIGNLVPRNHSRS
jgi:hypothetical protein